MNGRLVNFLWKFSKAIHPRILSEFGDLERNLGKASVKTAFRVYIGLMTFTSVVAGTAAFAVSFFLLLPFDVQVLHPLVLPALIGVSVGALAMGIYYSYPMYVAFSRGNKIDANLPTIANFMSVLASSGMPAESVFRSLGRVGEEFGLSKEVGGIVRDIELMGMDLHTALKKAAERSPSRGFATMLDGVITTSHMGGDLALYLRDEADKYKRGRMLSMKHFLDNLGIVAEAYITFMVAAPLMLIVMLSVMSFIGGGVTIASLDTEVLLNLLTFVLLPTGVSIMILIVDSMSPQR
jgi:flagellar protein FlaJ